MTILWLLLILICVFGLAPVESASGMPPRPIPPLFVTNDRCLSCHNGLVTPSGRDVSIGSNWQASMMANASRDPYWQAAVRRETMEHPTAAAHIQDECSACHMPMARFQARACGQEGTVFSHLPILPARSAADQLAADGVSCAMCHQIQAQKLGSEESFTAGFVVDTENRSASVRFSALLPWMPVEPVSCNRLPCLYRPRALTCRTRHFAAPATPCIRALWVQVVR